jgi:hypothetical protein
VLLDNQAVAKGRLKAAHDDTKLDAKYPALTANSATTLLCWHVGRRLLNENLHEKRAEYGKQILATVSRELTAEYGRGFSYTEITRMIRFPQLFPDERIVVTLSQQLSWSHWVDLNMRFSW